VHEIFGSWRWKRRIVALTVAYVLALSGLIASFATARATVAGPAAAGFITCHTDAGGAPPPAGDTNGKSCADSCCIGCLMLMADLPPPPTASVAIEQTQGYLLPTPVADELPFDPQVRSHQSRGPPQQA
jgi:hypothetical protein